MAATVAEHVTVSMMTQLVNAQRAALENLPNMRIDPATMRTMVALLKGTRAVFASATRSVSQIRRPSVFVAHAAACFCAAVVIEHLRAQHGSVRRPDDFPDILEPPLLLRVIGEPVVSESASVLAILRAMAVAFACGPDPLAECVFQHEKIAPALLFVPAALLELFPHGAVNVPTLSPDLLAFLPNGKMTVRITALDATALRMKDMSGMEQLLHDAEHHLKQLHRTMAGNTSVCQALDAHGELCDTLYVLYEAMRDNTVTGRPSNHRQCPYPSEADLAAMERTVDMPRANLLQHAPALAQTRYFEGMPRIEVYIVDHLAAGTTGGDHGVRFPGLADEHWEVVREGQVLPPGLSGMACQPAPVPAAAYGGALFPGALDLLGTTLPRGDAGMTESPMDMLTRATQHMWLQLPAGGHAGGHAGGETGVGAPIGGDVPGVLNVSDVPNVPSCAVPAPGVRRVPAGGYASLVVRGRAASLTEEEAAARMSVRRTAVCGGIVWRTSRDMALSRNIQDLLGIKN